MTKVGTQNTQVQVGQIWRDAIGLMRVMAVADNYAMVRRKGAIPFVWYVPALIDGCVLVPAVRDLSRGEA